MDVMILSGPSGVCQSHWGSVRAVGGLSEPLGVCQGRRGSVSAIGDLSEPWGSVKGVGGLSGTSGVCQGHWGSVTSHPVSVRAVVSLSGMSCIIDLLGPSWVCQGRRASVREVGGLSLDVLDLSG